MKNIVLFVEGISIDCAALGSARRELHQTA
jgi:hypothetical protein